MKTLRSRLFVSALFLLVFVPVVCLNAQKDTGGGGGGEGLAAVSTVAQSAFKIRVSSGEPPAVSTLTPLGTIVPAAKISLEGVSGEGPVSGLLVEIRGYTEALESVMLLNNGEELWGPQKTVGYQNPITIGRELYIHRGNRWNFTVAVKTRSTVPRVFESPAGRTFSVVVVGVFTHAEVEGALGISPQHTLTTALNIGRVAVIPKNIPGQELLPYLNRQWVLAVDVRGNSTEAESFPWLAFDLYANGGRVSDMETAIVDDRGVQLGGSSWVEESADEPGKGTARFPWPFSLEKGERKTLYLGVRMGHTWTGGGSIAGAMVPSKSVARGSLYGYRTPLLPNAPLAGPVMTVKPVAERYEVKVLSIDVPLQAGRNDLIRFSVTAPPDTDTVLPGFGIRFGWLPVEDRYDGLMLYGFTDNSFSIPLLGLQPDGAFAPYRQNLEGYQHFGGLEIQVVTGGESYSWPSAIHLMPGQTAYFAARANLTTAGQSSLMGVALAELATWKMLQFQLRGR